MGVVDEAIEDGAGDGGIADVGAPGIDRQLGGQQRRAGAVSIFEDLELGERSSSTQLQASSSRSLP